MAADRLAALTRVLVFFLISLVLLIVVGAPLQYAFGLPGHSAMEIFVFAGLPIAFVLLVDKKEFRPFVRLRMLNGKGIAKAVFLGLVGWFMAQLLGSAASLALMQLGGEMPQPYDFLFRETVGLALLSGALVPAICEELSFRGYVQGALRPLGPRAAIVLTGLLFGIMHMSLIRLVPLTVLGILWAMVVQRSGSILPGMIGHLFNNGIALGLAFFAQGSANPAETEASLAMLDSVPPMLMWIAIAVIAFVAVGTGVAAYFIAASFSPNDLARPVAVAAEQPRPEPEHPVFTNPEEVPSEVWALEGELTGLRQRRRRMLQATAAMAGLLSLTLFLLVAWQEIRMVFP